MKHDTGPNTNYHLPVIHLGDYRNLSIAVRESWFFFQLENARGPKSHCAFCKNAKSPCIGSASFWCKMSLKTTRPLWIQSMQLRSHPLVPDIAEDRSSQLIASPDVTTLMQWGQQTPESGYHAVSVILCAQVGLVWQEYLVCYTVNLYGPVITLIYTLLWLKRDHALSYQSRSPPV